MAGKGLFIVMASCPPEKEEAFNRWYNEEHVPKVLERVPGVLSGRRYKIIEGEDKYRFMAMYEFENYEELEKGMKQDTPIIKQLIREYDEAFGNAFGPGNRYHIRAIELKNLKLG